MPACDVIESMCNAHGHELGIICFCIFGCMIVIYIMTSIEPFLMFTNTAQNEMKSAMYSTDD